MPERDPRQPVQQGPRGCLGQGVRADVHPVGGCGQGPGEGQGASASWTVTDTIRASQNLIEYWIPCETKGRFCCGLRTTHACPPFYF